MMSVSWRTTASCLTRCSPNVAGVGVGLVDPPLASTAVGVVPPQQAGMASGINSTFRQVGIATGIALLGTLFSNDVKDEVLTRTAAVPGLSARGPEIAGAVQSGQIGDPRDRTAARARQAGRGNDHPGRLHHRPGPHPAGRGDHRVRGRRRIAGRYPQPGLRARRARRSGRSPEMRRPGRAGTQAGSGRVAATTTANGCGGAWPRSPAGKCSKPADTPPPRSRRRLRPCEVTRHRTSAASWGV